MEWPFSFPESEILKIFFRLRKFQGKTLKFRRKSDCQVRKNSLNIKFLGGIFLGHPGPRRRDVPDKNFMQVAFFCCFRQGVAGMSRDLGRDVPDLEKLYAVFSLFYTAEAQFVPATNPVCPWDIPGTKGGRKSLCVKSLCASFVP